MTNNSNVINFPGSAGLNKAFPKQATTPAPEKAVPSDAAEEKSALATVAIESTKGKGVAAGLLKALWVTLVLVWPVLKWIVSVDVFVRFLVMLYHWDTPGTYAGWTFIIHFVVLTLLTYFVSTKPKGM